MPVLESPFDKVAKLHAWIMESYCNSLVCLVVLILETLPKTNKGCGYMPGLLEKTELLILIGWVVENKKQSFGSIL